MKIPHKIWVLVALLMTGQQIFASKSAAVANNYSVQENMQSKSDEVTGIVSDNVGPVIGASVIIKGTTIGVITDIDGKFTINVPKGATLVVSFIGYEDKLIQYKGEKHLNISLDESVQQLEEVQVIAYGTTKKVTVTGSMSSVNSDDLLKTPASSLANAMTGKVTGLSSVQSSGQPGSDDPTVYVRGVGSLSESLSQPLMLVDGVERSFFQLDPNEVEDITVLKDASATAVFGVRGANGVIIVTTKRGQEGKAKVSFSTSAALQMPTRLPEFTNSYEYAKTYVDAQRHDGMTNGFAFSDETIEAFRTNANPIVYPSTDWVDKLIKKAAFQSQHNVSVSGGTKRVKYFASLGIFTQAGLFNTFEDEYNSNFKYNRYNYRMNLDIDLTNTTKMKINLGGRVNDKRQPNYEGSSDIKYLFRDIYWATPFAGPGIVDGKWVTVDSKKIANNLPDGSRDGLYPYYGRGYNTSAGNTLNFDLVLEQKLDFITKGLKAHVKGAYNSSVNYTKKRSCSFPSYEAFLLDNGEVAYRKKGDKTNLNFSEGNSLARDWYIEAALNYKRDIKRHHVSALLMYNQSMRYYPAGNFPGIPRGYVGLVGRVTYNYNTRYMIDANVGYNGSENFAEGNRFGLFPAFSVGWILSEEKFWEPLKSVVDYFKLRASFGIVGNDRTPGNDRFLYLPDGYNPNNSGFYLGIPNGTWYPGAIETRKGNPNVTWETAAKQNYGVDMHFLDSRLKLNFDYFIEHRKDILISHKMDPMYLAVKLPIANLGKVDNKGFEINLKWADQFNDKLNYNIGVNLSYAKNKVIYMDEVPQPYDYMCQTGKPVGQNFGYKYDGFFSEEDVANYDRLKGQEGGIPDHGAGFVPLAGDVKYKDLNNDHIIDYRDRTAIGHPNYPLLTAGLNFGLSYKGFDFSMTWSGATKTSRLLTDIFREPFGKTNSRSLMKYMIEDAWTPEKGNSAKAPAISFAHKANNYVDSDLWLRDASYLRLKNVEIGYSLPKKIVKKMNLDRMRFYASGYNLLTFDKLKIVDPESKATDQSMYPLVMVVNFGLKLGF